MTIIDTIETQETSITATVCDNAALYGAAPERGEFDTRDIWDPEDAIDAVSEAFRIIAQGVGPDGTQLADERENLLWGFVNTLHAQAQRLDRAADKLTPELRDLQHSQDGSEIKSRDVLGRVYEYFLGRFAGSEGKRGGEFYTPRSVVRTMVEMLSPHKGRVYDPCCGSGGMFVQSERFVEAHEGRLGDIAVYGQESNYTTWRLARMNLAVRGIDADIRWNSEGSFHKDELPDLRADYILANPPFNISDWGGDRLREDARWTFGIPPAGNANYAWLQHILHHLGPGGAAGVVLANGSMSSAQSGEGDIRTAMIEGDAVDCMIALPGQLFYSTQIPACLWFLARNKNPGAGRRDRRGEVLFIDARKLGRMVDRTRREFSDEDIARIAGAYHAWRGEPDADAYADVPGFCKAAVLDEIRKHGHVLTPGRYVGAEALEEDGEPFEVKMKRLADELRAQQGEAAKLDAAISKNLELLGFGKEHNA